MRLIDADALMNIYLDRCRTVSERYGFASSELGILSGAMKLLEIATTIEPERKKGKWIVRETACEDVEARCSCCGFLTLVNEPGNGLHMIDDLNFCPNCGADMRGDTHETN